MISYCALANSLPPPPLSCAQALQGGAASAALRARVESMSQMLHEQQEELAEGYRMAAAAKLSAAVGGWRGSALAHAVATWRQASALQSANVQQPEKDTWAAQEAEYVTRIQSLEAERKRAEKDSRGMALLVSDLEAQLEAVKQKGEAAPAAAEGRPRGARPPLSPAPSTLDAGRPAEQPRASSPARASSPKPTMANVEATLHDIARRPRSPSPQRTSLVDQLQDALSSRASASSGGEKTQAVRRRA